MSVKAPSPHRNRHASLPWFSLDAEPWDGPVGHEFSGEGDRHDNGHRVRADAYPNEDMYEDTGCHLYSACLSCPLPICIFETSTGVQLRARGLLHAKQLQTQRTNGLTITNLMTDHQLSRRQVFRLLATDVAF